MQPEKRTSMTTQWENEKGRSEIQTADPED